MKNLKYAAMIAAVALMTMGAANDCNGKGGGKATKASYAGDGATMFTDTTGRACSGDYSICNTNGSKKLLFDKGYKARYVDTTDRVNCDWTLYTINANGEKKVIKSGHYGTANIKVARTSRVQVWLKSQDCGDWKPTS